MVPSRPVTPSDPTRVSASAPGSRVKDAELARRMRLGDERALEIIFRTYYAGLVGFARRYVKSTEIAEELVQDLFFKVWSRRASLGEIDSLKTYLFRAARNTALNHLRRRKLEHDWLERAVSVSADEHVVSVSDEATEGELTEAVRAAVDRLPPRCREVFLLSRDGALTYNEIAKALGISIKTVETQMGRALKALRDSLKAHRT
ncbi:MAG: RNA polymerase sigma-70 factor [Gemmatimonadaceae bacterium]